MPRRRLSEKVEASIFEELKLRYPSGWTASFGAFVYGRTYSWARYHLERLVEQEKIRRLVRYVDRRRRISYIWVPPPPIRVELMEVTAYLKYEAQTAGAGKRYEYKVAAWVEADRWREYEKVIKMLWKVIWHFVPEEGVKFQEAEPEFGRTNREMVTEEAYKAKQWIYAVRLTPAGALERCGEGQFSDIAGAGAPDYGYGAIRDKGSGWIKTSEEVLRYSWKYVGGPPYR